MALIAACAGAGTFILTIASIKEDLNLRDIARATLLGGACGVFVYAAYVGEEAEAAEAAKATAHKTAWEASMQNYRTGEYGQGART
jgi:hypothetical protein